MVALKRESVVALGSVLMTTSVLANAFYKKQQFYLAMVYLSKSKTSMAALYFQAIVLLFYIVKALKLVFFGQLRHTEVENLMERCWYALTDTALAFTAFREEFTPMFFGLFCLLLLIKTTHSLVSDRIDYMERTPVLTRLFHLRIISLLILLSCVDLGCLMHAFNLVLLRGASLQLVFGFEYTILLLSASYVLSKYVLNCLDIYATPALVAAAGADAGAGATQWVQKSFILLHVEMVVSGLKVLLYIMFFSVMVRYFHFPLFAIRPLYMTLRAFRKSLYDIIMSRRALRLLNTLPRPTLQEIVAGDTTCIVCREEMSVAASCTKLPCTHILHTACLSSWFQRQQSCPLCRENIFQSRMRQTQPGQQGQQQAAGGAAAMPPGMVRFNGFQFAPLQQFPAGQQQPQQHPMHPFMFNFGGMLNNNNFPQIPNPFMMMPGMGGAMFPPQLFPQFANVVPQQQVPPAAVGPTAAAQPPLTATTTTSTDVGTTRTNVPPITTAASSSSTPATASTSAAVTVSTSSTTTTSSSSGVPPVFSPPNMMPFSMPFGGGMPLFMPSPPPTFAGFSPLADPAFMARMPAEIVHQLVQGLPSPPADLARRSVDELRAVENDERGALEARIDYLRRAQVCIDSAVALMDAYFSVFPGRSDGTIGASSALQSAVPASVADASTSTFEQRKQDEAVARGSSQPEIKSVDTVNDEDVEEGVSNGRTQVSQDELRRRRVQKLQRP